MKYTKEEQKQNRAELVKALRSGEYQQTRNQLRKDDSFCCLGVACDISGLGNWSESVYGKTKVFIYAENSGVMPSFVMDFYGFTHKGAIILSNMNDSGSSFEEISVVIEKGQRGIGQ